MKKIIFLFLFIFLVGCSNANQVKCYKNYYEDDDTYEEVIKATIENDKVTKLDATITFSSKEKAKSYCDALEKYLNYSSINIEYKCKGKKIEISNYDKYTFSSDSVIGYTKQELIDFYTAYQYACK